MSYLINKLTTTRIMIKNVIRYAICPNCKGTGEARWYQQGWKCKICKGEAKIVIEEITYGE